MPHPKGMISFQLQRKENGGIKGLVSLPGALKGTFIWNNKKVKLGNQTTIDL